MENLWPTKNNSVLTWYIDQCTWLFLQLYFLPYRTPSLHNEVDQWVQQVSLNGVRWSNLCKPNVTE